MSNLNCFVSLKYYIVLGFSNQSLSVYFVNINEHKWEMIMKYTYSYCMLYSYYMKYFEI